MIHGRIEDSGLCGAWEDALEIRWNPQVKAFFVDFGNVRFSVTRTAALLLADALHEAARRLPDKSGCAAKSGVQPQQHSREL